MLNFPDGLTPQEKIVYETLATTPTTSNSLRLQLCINGTRMMSIPDMEKALSGVIDKGHVRFNNSAGAYMVIN